jgi:hypothetical protein
MPETDCTPTYLMGGLAVQHSDCTLRRTLRCTLRVLWGGWRHGDGGVAVPYSCCTLTVFLSNSYRGVEYGTLVCILCVLWRVPL